ncbi:MAG: hypothetical protein MI700_09565 [Balneolales bacterium]|nr:hypothetical protein [Balneolales bacterium]
MYKSKSALLFFSGLLVSFLGCDTGKNDLLLSPNVLNSERIEMKFGSFGIDVLLSDSLIRVSNLYSIEGEEKISRTFAVVMYSANLPEELLYEHSKILSGGSIGEVFKEGGWNITKSSIYFGEIEEKEVLEPVYGLMGIAEHEELAVYMYDFLVTKDLVTFKYVTIAELYNPEYLTIQDLEDIYTIKAEEYANYGHTLDQVFEGMRRLN